MIRVLNIAEWLEIQKIAEEVYSNISETFYINKRDVIIEQTDENTYKVIVNIAPRFITCNITIDTDGSFKNK